jgi:formate dehydrogenase subunit gamma
MKRLGIAVVLLYSAAAWAQSPGPQPQTEPRAQEIQEQQQRQATQPGNNAPVWRNVQSGAPNYTSVQGRETSVLIQPPARFPGQHAITTAGEAWRQFRNGPVTFIGGWLVALVAVAIVGFYFWKGAVKLHERPTGRLLRRFSTLEQVVHWTAAISFCVLGLSGLIMLFGKHLLLPIIGYTLFAWLTMLGKNLHNFIAPFFILSVVAMILMWFRDNLPRAYDWQWFRKAWAFFARGEHIPSGRFNAGEKAWFWGGVIVLSVMVSWSGLILLFPNFDQTRAVMQDAWIWHASAALVYIAVSLGHIYMGTIGVEGAYGNMRTGYTDEAWAKEHHSIWYDEVKAGRSRAPGGAVPAGAPHMEQDQS